ncbi:NADAR family protein [Leucobacter sp. cx-169]|nr:NADAR family protein [Leucobacter sp. cx-169]
MNNPIAGFSGEHRFLSNFWPVPGGVVFGHMYGPTTEHVYQAAKTLNPSARLRILSCETPGAAKRYGQELATIRPDWDSVKLGVMASLTKAKFSHPELADLLAATGDAEIIEGNHWCDTFWGVCSCDTHEGAGQNWLGKILMIERSQRLAAHHYV